MGNSNIKPPSNNIRQILKDPNLSISKKLEICEKYMEDNNFFRDLNIETVDKSKNLK